MIRRLAGKQVVLDASGEGFRQAVPAGPWLIKPNVDELSEYAGKRLDSPQAILEQGRAILEGGRIHSVVISMGEEGAIFVEEGQAVWAAPPKVEVQSTVAPRPCHGGRHRRGENARP